MIKTGTVSFLKSTDKQKHRNCQTRRKEKGDRKINVQIHLSPWPVTSIGTQKKKKKEKGRRKQHNMSPSTVYITYIHSKRPFPQIKCL